MAKLNGASALPAEAQNFLESYKTLLKEMPEAEATDATIKLIYKSYYAEMGGAGVPPEVPAQSNAKATNNVTAFKRPPAQRKPAPRQTPQGPGRKTEASGGADLCLPGRGLCRDPVFLAVRRLRQGVFRLRPQSYG